MMIAKLGSALGRLVLLLALAALITGMSLFVLGGWLTTWPILRLSPRGQRKAALTNLAAAVMGVATAFAPEELPDILPGVEPPADG